jgi:S-adenosylmethionine:tRNA ribosyltransferase-isomerase
MKTADYDFDLPEALIASRPAEVRDGSRLLVLHRDGELEHRRFFHLPEFLHAGDMLILNNSKVFPARLTGHKETGGRLEMLLVRELSPGSWSILAKERYTGRIRFSEDFRARVSAGKTVFFDNQECLSEMIWKTGSMPLPPYIKRQPDEEDKKRYQTVYASVEGSIAAPTAGLHFTRSLLEDIRSKGVLIREVTLHVGIGTFRPVRTSEIEDHVMETEIFEMDQGLPAEIATAKKRGGRIIAVGTTATRVLEGYKSGKCEISSRNGVIKGATDIFIHEGFRPFSVDSLLTNFHLPRSTPLMLTSVFAGRKNLLNAYRSAILTGYRFFTYGDAMLVL